MCTLPYMVFPFCQIYFWKSCLNWALFSFKNNSAIPSWRLSTR